MISSPGEGGEDNYANQSLPSLTYNSVYNNNEFSQSVMSPTEMGLEAPFGEKLEIMCKFELLSGMNLVFTSLANRTQSTESNESREPSQAPVKKRGRRTGKLCETKRKQTHQRRCIGVCLPCALARTEVGALLVKIRQMKFAYLIFAVQQK